MNLNFWLSIENVRQFHIDYIVFNIVIDCIFWSNFIGFDMEYIACRTVVNDARKWTGRSEKINHFIWFFINIWGLFNFNAKLTMSTNSTINFYCMSLHQFRSFPFHEFGVFQIKFNLHYMNEWNWPFDGTENLHILFKFGTF